MPKDKSGKFQLNNQKVRHADKLVASDNPEGSAKSAGEDPGNEAPVQPHATMHDHGDGTGHTEMGDGRRIEHPDMEATKSKHEALMNEDCAPAMAGGGDHGDWGEE